MIVAKLLGKIASDQSPGIISMTKISGANPPNIAAVILNIFSFLELGFNKTRCKNRVNLGCVEPLWMWSRIYVEKNSFLRG